MNYIDVLLSCDDSIKAVMKHRKKFRSLQKMLLYAYLKPTIDVWNERAKNYVEHHNKSEDAKIESISASVKYNCDIYVELCFMKNSKLHKERLRARKDIYSLGYIGRIAKIKPITAPDAILIPFLKLLYCLCIELDIYKSNIKDMFLKDYNKKDII
jgi:hypothetical protein